MARCFRAAFIRARPSASAFVGFSQNTSLPASIAISDIGTCQWSGVEITTASIDRSSRMRRKSVKALQPAFR